MHAAALQVTPSHLATTEGTQAAREGSHSDPLPPTQQLRVLAGDAC